MKQKTVVSVGLLYAVIISLTVILFGGAAIAARENALTPLQFITMKTQSQALQEAIAAGK